MNLSKLFDKLLRVVHDNGPEILTAMGVVGVGTTAYLAAKGAPQAKDAIESEKAVRHVAKMPQPTPFETFQIVWPFYVPAVISGVGTVSCIVLASKGNAKRTAAAVTAYSVTERAFSDYREKVTHELGRNKDQKVLDAVSQDYVRQHPPPPKGQIVVLGKKGDTLFLENYTGRYFRSDMETIRKAKNDVNEWIITDGKASLNDFYDAIGLAFTENSSRLGWNRNELMDLNFSAVINDDGDEPCMAFSYNYVEPLV